MCGGRPEGAGQIVDVDAEVAPAAAPAKAEGTGVWIINIIVPNIRK